jgi:hypothetical protein
MIISREPKSDSELGYYPSCHDLRKDGRSGIHIPVLAAQNNPAKSRSNEDSLFFRYSLLNNVILNSISP